MFLHELHQGISLQVDTGVARDVIDKDGQAYGFRDSLVVLDECSFVNLVIIGSNTGHCTGSRALCVLRELNGTLRIRHSDLDYDRRAAVGLLNYCCGHLFPFVDGKERTEARRSADEEAVNLFAELELDQFP